MWPTCHRSCLLPHWLSNVKIYSERYQWIFCECVVDCCEIKTRLLNKIMSRHLAKQYFRYICYVTFIIIVMNLLCTLCTPFIVAQKQFKYLLWRYVECSARTKEGVRDVFERATRAALQTKKQKKKGGCDLL